MSTLNHQCDLESESMLLPGPIYSIDDDILLLIVQTNANMFADKNAFLHTRHASQVCRSWRQTLLESARLWARLLDIDQLGHMPAWWGHEVLRRANTVPLWIKSTRMGRYIKEVNFLLHILDTRWDKVERLYIRSGIFDDRQAMVTYHSWKCLFQPAPSLKELGLYVSGLKDSSSELLGGSAPLLKVFRANNVSYSVRASWLKDLRSVTLVISTVAEIVEMLQGTPLLEYLRLERLEDDEDTVYQQSPRLPVVPLCHLELLDIASTQLLPCSTFLKHIALPSGCSLVAPRILVPSKEDQSYIPADRFVPLSQILDRYIACYAASRMSISLSSKSLSIEFLNEEKTRSSTICLEGKSGITAYVIEIFLRALSSTLSKTISLKFGTFRTSGQVISFVISFLLPKIHEMITLDTDERFVFHLLEAQDNTTEVLLPVLHTIRLGTFNMSFLGNPGDDNEKARSALVDYLVFRTKAGKPINTLDLTLCSELDVNAIIPVLENSSLAPGMKVMWARYGISNITQRFEYTCGIPEVSE